MNLTDIVVESISISIQISQKENIYVLKQCIYCSVNTFQNVYKSIKYIYIYVAYLVRREDNPIYGEEGFYDSTCEAEEIIKIYR